MRIGLSVLLLLIVFPGTTPVWPQMTDSSEAEIRSVMAQALKASLEGDSDRIASLMADEYLQTDASGHIQDKSTWLKEYFNPIAELIRAGKFRWEVYDPKDVQIRISGDSAVAIGTLEAIGSGARWAPQTHTWVADPNASFNGSVRFTHVYVRRNGKWLLAALHNAIPFVGSGRNGEGQGLRWPDPPKKTPMRVRLVAVALALPRSSFFSSYEVFVAEREIAHEEFSLIKLVFTFLPYQPRLSESGFDYSVVHEVSAWRDPDCDETVAQLTARSMPDRHEPLIYSRNVPREDLDRRRIPLPCYETNADDYIKASFEPVAPPPKPPEPVLKKRPNPR